MDFITELPSSTLGGRTYDSILVVVDRLLKISHYIPVKGTLDALGLVEVFYCKIVRLYGLLRSIVSNRGVLFTLAY